MEKKVTYADILTQVLRTESTHQPHRLPIRVVSVCDVETNQFLLIATGWENKRRVETILFHARLVENKVVIEDDNIEEGLTGKLIDAGISSDDVLTALAFERSKNNSVAA